MPRKKVTLKLIADRSSRRATFKTRRASLMKKAHELATLCGVDACVVVHGEGGASPPEMFPPSAAEAARVLNRFKDLSEMEQRKKMLDMEGFLQQRNEKLKAQLEKARRENDKREAALLLSGAIDGHRPVMDLSAEELTILGRTVNERLKSIDERIQKLLEQGHSDPLMALHLSLASLPPSLASYTVGAGAGKTEVHTPAGTQGRLMDVHAPAGAQGWLVNMKTEGFGGGNGSFGGDAADANTLGGAGDIDMIQSPTTFTGFPWAAQGPSFFPPPM